MFARPGSFHEIGCVPPAGSARNRAEEELDLVADGSTRSCGPEEPWFGARLVGTDAATGNTREAALTGNPEIFGRAVCFYQEFTPKDVRRLIEIDPTELERCNLSLLAECDARGFDAPGCPIALPPIC